jgi:hypothetical protein
MHTGLAVGVARRDITPASPQHLHGYSARHEPSVGLLEPLSLRCLALGQGERRLLIVAVDMVGIPHPVCRRWYDILERATGIGFPNILVSCTHTHFAPALHATVYTNPEAGLVEPDPAYAAAVEERLVEAAREALARLQPAVLETARAPVPGVLYNRRTIKADGMVEINFTYPRPDDGFTFSPVDDELTILRFRNERGIVAALANFGCHPVTGTDRVPEGMRHLSADYPYHLREELGRAWHCPVLFTLGAAGDTVPANRQGDCRERIGRVLADTAALAERRFRPEPEARLAAVCRTVAAATNLSFDPAGAPAAFQAARAALLAGNTPANRARYEDCGRALLRSRAYPGNRLEIPVQCLRLGSQSLVALPFEVFSEISRRLKATHPGTVLVSCAGGYQGYLPLAHEFARGGYGATPDTTHFAQDTGDRLLAEAARLLAEE